MLSGEDKAREEYDVNKEVFGSALNFSSRHYIFQGF